MKLCQPIAYNIFSSYSRTLFDAYKTSVSWEFDVQPESLLGKIKKSGRPIKPQTSMGRNGAHASGLVLNCHEFMIVQM